MIRLFIADDHPVVRAGLRRIVQDAPGLEVHAMHSELDHACATTAFRILQETLTNVARHARATEVRISLRVSTEILALEVSDNGRGISEAEMASPRSLGLVGIRERAIACGGELVIRGARGRGTTVSVSIPLRPTGGGAK